MVSAAPPVSHCMPAMLAADDLRMIASKYGSSRSGRQLRMAIRRRTSTGVSSEATSSSTSATARRTSGSGSSRNRTAALRVSGIPASASAAATAPRVSTGAAWPLSSSEPTTMKGSRPQSSRMPPRASRTSAGTGPPLSRPAPRAAACFAKCLADASVNSGDAGIVDWCSAPPTNASMRPSTSPASTCATTPA